MEHGLVVARIETIVESRDFISTGKVAAREFRIRINDAFQRPADS